MNVVNVIGYFSEILTTVVTFFLAFFIIKKDRKYIANVLVGLGVASIGGYTLSIFILDISATEWVIHLFLPLALVIIMLGTLFLYFGFQVLSNSVKWFDKKIRWVPYLAFWAIYSIWIMADQSLTEIISTIPVVQTRFNIVPLAIMVLYLFFFLIITIIEIRRTLKIVDGVVKKRMLYFKYGIIIMIFAIIEVIPAHLFDGLIVLSYIFFYILLIGSIIIAYAFLNPFSDARQEEKEVEKVEEIEEIEEIGEE
jgi:hypothetical protein